MGVQDVADEGDLIAEDNMTIGDLKELFGREATRRGLEYMRSLSEADRRFRKVDKERMEKGYEDAGIDGDTESPAIKWARQSEENGLGLEDGS